VSSSSHSSQERRLFQHSQIFWTKPVQFMRMKDSQDSMGSSPKCATIQIQMKFITSARSHRNVNLRPG